MRKKFLVVLGFKRVKNILKALQLRWEKWGNKTCNTISTLCSVIDIVEPENKMNEKLKKN